MPQDGVRVPVPNFGDYFSGRIGGVIHNILHTCGTREQFLQHLTTYCFAIRPACRSSQLPFAPMSGRPSQCLQMTFPPSDSKILTQQPPNKTASRYDCLTLRAQHSNTSSIEQGACAYHRLSPHPWRGSRLNSGRHAPTTKKTKKSSFAYVLKRRIFSRWLWWCPIRPLAREASPPLPLRLRSSHQPRCLVGDRQREHQMPAHTRPRSRTITVRIAGI